MLTANWDPASPAYLGRQQGLDGHQGRAVVNLNFGKGKHFLCLQWSLFLAGDTYLLSCLFRKVIFSHLVSSVSLRGEHL